MGAVAVLAMGVFAMSMFSQGVYGELAEREAALHRPMHDLLQAAMHSEENGREGGRSSSVRWSDLSDLDGVPMGQKLRVEGVSLVDVAAASCEVGANLNN